MSWARRLTSKAADLKARQRKEEAEVEHDIDSHPLEPQLSSQVVEMMRMEDSAGKAGSTVRRKQLTARIDGQIASECSAALNYIVDLHTKQRKEVWARHAAERSKLRRSVFKHCAKHGASGAVTAAEPHPRPPSPGSRAIFVGAETQALREASANWLRAERFSLLTAFRQQVQRVQTEWSDHVQQLRDEYVREYRAMTGSDPPEADFAGMSSGSRSKGERNWLSKAKQESLIHTAPVLAPEVGRPAAMSASSAHGVRERFQTSVAAVVRQQEEAVRWILRQCRRMLAQAAAQERERLCVARYRDRVTLEWAAIDRCVEAAGRSAAEAAAEAAAAAAAEGRSDGASSSRAGPRFVGAPSRPSGTVASSAPALVSPGSRGSSASTSPSSGRRDASAPLRLGELRSTAFSKSASGGGTDSDALRAIPERGAPANGLVPASGTSSAASARAEESWRSAISTGSAAEGSGPAPLTHTLSQGGAFSRATDRTTRRRRADTMGDPRSAATSRAAPIRGTVTSRHSPGAAARKSSRTGSVGSSPPPDTRASAGAFRRATAAPATAPAAEGGRVYRVGSTGSGLSLRRSGKLGLSSSPNGRSIPSSSAASSSSSSSRVLSRA